MSDITSGAVSHARASVVDESAQQTYNRIAETLQNRKVYGAQNENPRSLGELAYARTQMQPRSEAVAAMYARTVKAFGNEQGTPQGTIAQQGGSNVLASNGKASGSASDATAATSDWSPVSLPMLKRIYGGAATFESPIVTGDSSSKDAAGMKKAALKNGKDLSARKAEDKTATAGGRNVRFAGLKSLMRGLGNRLSSLFTNVRSARGEAVPRFMNLSDGLRAKVKEHEELRSARHEKIRAHMKSRGDYDVRTQKFADLFARRMKHFDALSANFRKERLVTYKQIRKETEALLKENKGKVFTPDEAYHTMIHNLENINNIFFQDIDMELFELKITGK